MNIERNVPSNPKIGDKGSITVTIPMKEILDDLGALDVATAGFSAMVSGFKAILKRSLTAGGSPVVFVTFTLMSLATTIVQMIFDVEIEPVKVKVTTKLEYQNVEYTQQGLTVHIPSWAVVDRTIKMVAS